MSGTISAIEPAVTKLSYWAAFDEEDRAALRGVRHVIKTVQAHHYVIREREVATHCCVMLSGFSVRHKIVAGGMRQIVAIHMRGDLVDLQNSMLGIADHSVQMLTRGEVAMIPREEIRRLALERPAIAQAMWADTLVDGSIFREWIANVGRRDARTRIAHLLCEFSLRLQVAGLGEQTGYELPMTQEQLADATGLTPVHVNRTIKSLESDTLITRTSARSVTIGNWQRLAEAGDFDSTYLHLRGDEPALT
ncbi:MAG TPA: Crp/Fnr family transcriptional regulator [Allosphingosinicella sp.]|jgi:CRP-like cAMP-binding protein